MAPFASTGDAKLLRTPWALCIPGQNISSYSCITLASRSLGPWNFRDTIRNWLHWVHLLEKKRQGPNGPPVGTTETRPQAVLERRYRPYRELGTMSPEFQAQDRCLIMSDNKTLSDIMAQARLRRFKAFLGQKTACCGPFVQKTQSPFIPSSLDVDSSRLPSDAGRAHPRPWLRAHGRRGRRRGPVPAVCHRYSSPVLY